jgi:hypothetical protein
MKLVQLDVKTVFFNAELQEELYPQPVFRSHEERLKFSFFIGACMD